MLPTIITALIVFILFSFIFLLIKIYRLKREIEKWYQSYHIAMDDFVRDRIFLRRQLNESNEHILHLNRVIDSLVEEKESNKSFIYKNNKAKPTEQITSSTEIPEPEIEVYED